MPRLPHQVLTPLAYLAPRSEASLGNLLDASLVLDRGGAGEANAEVLRTLGRGGPAMV